MTTHSIFHDAKRILVIKPRAIGDILLSTPVLKNLHSAFPSLQIDFLCETFAADVVRGNPALHEVLTFNKKNDSTFSVIRRVREKKYDIVMDLFANPRTAMITRWSGAKHRIGFPFRGRRYAYTHLIQPRGGEVHNIDFNLDVLRSFSIPVTDSFPDFFLEELSRAKVEAWFKEQNITAGRIVGINPSGGWYTKKWNKDSYAALADRIAGEKNTSVVFFWGPGELQDVEYIRFKMKQPSYIIPQTSLKEMGAFLERCSYVISNDSGPMHISAALGVPTLGIYGPTNPHLQGPYGPKNRWVREESLDCLECNLTECPIGNVCMSQLSAETVFQSFSQLVTQSR